MSPRARAVHSTRIAKRHPCACLPRRPSRKSWNDDARGSHYSVHLPQTCSQAKEERTSEARAMAISRGPLRDQGPSRSSRHPQPHTTPQAPFTEILIPEGSEGHEETGNKEENDRDSVLLNRETWITTSTYDRKMPH